MYKQYLKLGNAFFHVFLYDYMVLTVSSQRSVEVKGQLRSKDGENSCDYLTLNMWTACSDYKTSCWSLWLFGIIIYKEIFRNTSLGSMEICNKFTLTYKTACIPSDQSKWGQWEESLSHVTLVHPLQTRQSKSLMIGMRWAKWLPLLLLLWQRLLLS